MGRPDAGLMSTLDESGSEVEVSTDSDVDEKMVLENQVNIPMECSCFVVVGHLNLAVKKGKSNLIPLPTYIFAIFIKHINLWGFMKIKVGRFVSF
jgi:hypothetical protein